MYEASVSGQKFSYKPWGSSTTRKDESKKASLARGWPFS